MRKSRTSKLSHARKAGHGGKASRSSSRSSGTRNPRDIKRPQQLSSGTETSSLDPRAKFEIEPSDEPMTATQRMDSGDLQTVPKAEDSTLESSAELVDEGQDLQAEMVEAIEDSAENEGKARKPYEPPGVKAPEFKDRNRL
jgi:hypothetical protein